MQPQQTYGEFSKVNDRGDLIYRTAYSPADAIRFQFDGWQKVEPLPPIQPVPPSAPAERATGRARTTPAESATRDQPTN